MSRLKICIDTGGKNWYPAARVFTLQTTADQASDWISAWFAPDIECRLVRLPSNWYSNLYDIEMVHKTTRVNRV